MKQHKLGMIAFLGVVFIFLPLFILSTDTWSARASIDSLLTAGGWKAFWLWQFLHFILGCGFALLAAPTGERSIYFIMFVLFLFLVLLFNLNLLYAWGFVFLTNLQAIIGLMNVVWGFFSVMFTRCYTVRITAKRSY